MRKPLKKHLIVSSLILGIAVILVASAVGLSNGAQPPAPRADDSQDLVTIAISTRFRSPSIPVTAYAGDQFTVTLPSNPSTGYSWQMLNQPDAKVLRKTVAKYNEPEKPMPGKPGTETWTFKAVGKGKQSIEMVYLRPWEKGVTPERKQVFEVTVL